MRDEGLNVPDNTIKNTSFQVLSNPDPPGPDFFIDDFAKSYQCCFSWLSKNFDIQDVVVFQVRDYTYSMSSF